MKMKVLKAAGIALALGMASSAMGVPLPQFQIDPPGAPTQFYATSLNGPSSELLIGTATTLSTGTGQGWFDITGITNDGPLGTTGALLPGLTRLGIDYQLYLTFSLTATYTGGGTGVGTVGSNYAVTQLDFSVWRDDGLDTTFTTATLGTPATVAGNGTDVLLGGGSILSGVAGIDAQGGAFINALTTYANTAAGNLFFVDPIPFYSLAFSAFNNTSQGVNISPGCATADPTDVCQVAIGASGIADFNKVVPEPGTLALLGALALGFGAVSRRVRKG